MDIKATQLQNTASTTQNTAVQVAEKTADGKSFVDEMNSLPTTDKNLKQNIQNSKENSLESNDTKELEFISINNQEVLKDKNILENQKKHKIAEKELEEEIVLMNDQKSIDKKDFNLKSAQISVAKKSDEIIKEENQKSAVTQDLNVCDSNENTSIEQNLLNGKFVNNTNFENNNLIAKNSELPNDTEVAGLLANADINTQKRGEFSKKQNSLEINVDETEINETTKLNENFQVVDKNSNKKAGKLETKKLDTINKDVNTEDKLIKPENKIAGVEENTINIDKNMKILTVEPLFKETNTLENILKTNKTTDIVDFIDANLKTTKKSKASETSATKKSSNTSGEKTLKMTEADAKFFNNLVETNQQITQEGKVENQHTILKDIEAAKSAQVSKTLLNALKESQETNKSFRVDFDSDISVILRVNKHGKISAEFLPGDAAVEQYLKTNIPLLKQKFQDEGLEYENLSYRQQKNSEEESNRRRNNRNNNNKENGYE